MDIQKIEKLFAKAKANKDNSTKFLQYCREMKEEIYREENKNGNEQLESRYRPSQKK